MIMAFRSFKVFPFRLLMLRSVNTPIIKTVFNSSRQYYGRKSLFSELSSAMQLVENRMKDMDRFFSECLNDSPVRIPRLFSPFDVHQPQDMPIIKSDEKGRVYHLDVDMTGFQPEDISIQLKNDILTIHGKKREEKEGSHFSREYSYEYRLPEDVNPDTIKSVFHQGVLSVDAPLPALEEAKEIPIQKVDIPKDN